MGSPQILRSSTRIFGSAIPPTAPHFAHHPKRRPWCVRACVCAEAATAASAHTHHLNEGSILGRPPEIKIPISYQCTLVVGFVADRAHFTSHSIVGTTFGVRAHSRAFLSLASTTCGTTVVVQAIETLTMQIEQELAFDEDFVRRGRHARHCGTTVANKLKEATKGMDGPMRDRRERGACRWEKTKGEPYSTPDRFVEANRWPSQELD